MKTHLNTLFVTTNGACLSKQGESVVVRVDGQVRIRLPLISLEGIVCLGRVRCSTSLMGACVRHNVTLSFMTQYGRLIAAVQGFHPGNVLLRREQYRVADDPQRSADIARACVIGKLVNYRTILRRAAREAQNAANSQELNAAAQRIDSSLLSLSQPQSLETVRGIEGEASATWFGVFDKMILNRDPTFRFCGRTRRPPLDAVNAMLSFLYSVLTHDVRSACQAVGLDAAVGYLHRDKPGRPGLALDLMEELRPVFVDRLVLTLINRRQVPRSAFRFQPTGAVLLTDKGRRILLEAYQSRKREAITHPFLAEKMTLGLVPHVQARLMAHHIRGNLDAYPPFAIK